MQMMKKKSIKLFLTAAVVFLFALLLPAGVKKAYAASGINYPSNGAVFYGTQNMKLEVTPGYGTFAVYTVYKNGGNITGFCNRGNTVYVGQFVEGFGTNNSSKQYIIDLGSLSAGDYKAELRTYKYNGFSFYVDKTYTSNFRIESEDSAAKLVPEFRLFNSNEKQSKTFDLEVSGNFSKVKVYRAVKKKGPYKVIKTTSEQKFTVTALAGKTNYFKLQGYVGNTATKWSKIVSVTPVKKPAKVKNLKAKKTAAGVVLTWKKPAGVTHVYVYRCDSKGNYAGAPNNTDGVSPFKGTKLVDATVEPGKTYYYRVESLHWKQTTMLDYFLRGALSKIIKVTT